jgi:hypothetical protein
VAFACTLDCPSSRTGWQQARVVNGLDFFVSYWRTELIYRKEDSRAEFWILALKVVKLRLLYPKKSYLSNRGIIHRWVVA